MQVKRHAKISLSSKNEAMDGRLSKNNLDNSDIASFDDGLHENDIVSFYDGCVLVRLGHTLTRLLTCENIHYVVLRKLQKKPVYRTFQLST